MSVLTDLKKICTHTFENFSLRSLTTFKIGGIAKYVVYPEQAAQLREVFDYCIEKDLDCFVLGAGSNVLADDNGFDGVIICTKKLNQISKISPCRIRAGAGVLLSSIVRFCAAEGLTGLEWAANIPGTIGGAVVMNAGAFHAQISTVDESVTVYTNGKTEILPKSKLFFDYRHSVFTNSKNCVIMEVVLKLKKGSPEQINANIRQNVLARASTQNVGYASAGSVFKRQGKVIPARLIEECGLKGERIGDAMVSPVHSGYIVNLGKATGSQVTALIEKIKERVFNKFHEQLECEIIFLKGENKCKDS